MSAADLSEMHIADLHERAAAAGIDGYRRLGRDELVKRLEGGGGGRRLWRRRRAPDIDQESDTDELAVVGPAGTATPEVTGSDDDAPERPRRRRGRRGGRGRGGGGRERLDEGERSSAGSGERSDRSSEEDAPTEDITGTLEITRQRHGFLSVEGSDDDVYISASQIRRCELVEGDEVAGPARAPRRGERHRALVRVNSVNGEEPVSEPAAKGSRAPEASKFDSLTPALPTRRIELPEDADTLVRAADLLAPLAFGQRVLVRAAPRSGRTTFLRGLAQAVAATDGIELTVLLIDERPEEAQAWTEALPSADLALAPADLSPAEQVKVAVKALERARKQAEDGEDAVLICDSLTRLGVAAGGVDEVKRLFGSGRELSDEGAGSLTVVATTLGDGDDGGAAERAVQTTETALVALDASLASEGIVPALRFGECRATGETELLAPEILDGLRRLRTSLAPMMPPAAAALIREKLAKSPSNGAILRNLA